MKSNRKNILIIGYFGYITNQLDGQTIKTREILDLFREKCHDNIKYFDTQTFKSKPYSIIYLLRLVRTSDIIVYLPGQGNLKCIFPFIRLFLKKKSRIIYPVVGGWLADFLKQNKRYVKYLQRFSLIGVETRRLKDTLEKVYNLQNVEMLPNFRIKDYVPYKNEPQDGLRIVFMARITEAKGCNLIFKIAEKLKDWNNCNIRFMFYGKIDPEYEETFYENITALGDNCAYGGVIQPSDVYLKLNQHDVLLLPTHYEGEGFPGSIIDAYKAGIPVIVSKWKDLSEFVIEGETGFVIEHDDINEYLNKIYEISADKASLRKLKMQAYEESKRYTADKAWETIKNYME